jgi:hypothetical protein
VTAADPTRAAVVALLRIVAAGHADPKIRAAAAAELADCEREHGVPADGLTTSVEVWRGRDKAEVTDEAALLTWVEWHDRSSIEVVSGLAQGAGERWPHVVARHRVSDEARRELLAAAAEGADIPGVTVRRYQPTVVVTLSGAGAAIARRAAARPGDEP